MSEQTEQTTIQTDAAPLFSRWKHKARNRVIEILGHSEQHDDYQVRNVVSGRISWIFGAYLRQHYEPYLDERIVRVDSVAGTYFRKGACEVCGKSGVERTKTFEGPTMEACNSQAEAWGREPLAHKKCEG